MDASRIVGMMVMAICFGIYAKGPRLGHPAEVAREVLAMDATRVFGMMAMAIYFGTYANSRIYRQSHPWLSSGWPPGHRREARRAPWRRPAWRDRSHPLHDRWLDD